MKLQTGSHRKTSGFTLIEMIGVLAVIAILASMLVPRVFQAIGDSKINNAAGTCNSIKSSVSEYYGKYGKIGGIGGAALTLTGGVFEEWDSKILLAEGIVDKPFAVRIGDGTVGATGSRLRVVDISGLTTGTVPAANNGAYDLDASGTSTANGATQNDISGSLLVEAVIPGVDLADAAAFNNRLDGATLGSTTTTNGTSDLGGRVKYAITTNGLAEVHVYIAHK